MLQPYRDGLHAAHIPLGLWLRERYPRETWAAIGDAGTAPFFSRLNVIDLWGLTTRRSRTCPASTAPRSRRPVT